ncbi:hypothetical protein DFH09DRAFT_1178278 [Mycena vulgaris]|nr:hypothetical protein DFH09DRAFT_1178278 [Mycena vulgaris]
MWRTDQLHGIFVCTIWLPCWAGCSSNLGKRRSGRVSRNQQTTGQQTLDFFVRIRYSCCDIDSLDTDVLIPPKLNPLNEGEAPFVPELRGLGIGVDSDALIPPRLK